MRLPALLIALFALGYAFGQNSKWTDIERNKEGKVVFYWYPNNVVIHESKDIIDGIEHDLAVSFIQYLHKKYDVNIELKWIESQSFTSVLDQVLEAEDGGVFGASSISITEERKKLMNFTASYISDIAVLVSNVETPVAYTESEFVDLFRSATAITIPNTTLSKAIYELDSTLELNVQTKYVTNSGDIISTISTTPNSFGYIDLPNFLIMFDKAKIKRQYFFPFKGEGIAFIYPLDSDWEIPVKDYFQSDQFKNDKQRIIINYLGADISDVFERIAKSAELGPSEEILISQREKEIQYNELLTAASKDHQQLQLLVWMTIGIISVCLILIFLFMRYKIKSKANKLLLQEQAQVASRNAQLQLLNEEKNDLINVIAHDLRSPLTTILGASQLLNKNRIEHEEDKLELFGHIDQSAKKIEMMIKKILDVNAIESGNRNLHIEPVDIRNVINTVIALQRETAALKQIKIMSDFPQDVYALTDQFYLSQVIENLLTNAIKFSAAGQVVKITGRKVMDEVCIEVSDFGPGLTEEDKIVLFKKYQKLSARPTAGEPSHGIGLSIVKDYVDRLNGTISFESTLGVGTTFQIRLPGSDLV